MSLPNAPGGNQVLDFEWNVFEQALDWHNPPPEQSVLSEASVSPEAISYFNPETHTILPPSYPPPASGRLLRGPKKSASSRARRQTQNREAQRAFRIRQRQRFEDLENELHSLRSRYENLQEKYASLHLLYMQRVSFDGSMWGSVSSTGTVGTTVTAGSSENTVGSGRRESDIAASQPPKKEKEGSGHVELQLQLQLQQADVATWLSAIGQAN